MPGHACDRALCPSLGALGEGANLVSWPGAFSGVIPMSILADRINRILGEKDECLTAVEITLRLNAEFSESKNPYRISEIVGCADKMPNLSRSGREYCRKV